jgi:hypothetical protein
MGPKSEVRIRNREVCFAPNIGHRQLDLARLKNAKGGSRAPSFEHPVGAAEQ